MPQYFEHKQTGKRYAVVSVDEAAGTMTLKGSHTEFKEPNDSAHFERMGYVLRDGDIVNDPLLNGEPVQRPAPAVAVPPPPPGNVPAAPTATTPPAAPSAASALPPPPTVPAAPAASAPPPPPTVPAAPPPPPTVPAAPAASVPPPPPVPGVPPPPPPPPA